MLIDHSNKTSMKLLVNSSRLATNHGADLAKIHRQIGGELTSFLLDEFPTKIIDIEHPTGKSKGVKLCDSEKFVVIPMMRAGLFLAEGVWEKLPNSTLLVDGIESKCLAGKNIILVDSVINTGRSAVDIIDMVIGLKPKCIWFFSIVCFETTCESLLSRYPQVNFNFARISKNSYKGCGKTDTGDRLFNTV